MQTEGNPAAILSGRYLRESKPPPPSANVLQNFSKRIGKPPCVGGGSSLPHLRKLAKTFRLGRLARSRNTPQSFASEFSRLFQDRAQLCEDREVTAWVGAWGAPFKRDVSSACTMEENLGKLDTAREQRSAISGGR